MQGTIQQHVDGMTAGETTRKALRIPMRAIGDRVSTQTINSGALRISGGAASPLAQLNATYLGVTMGKLVSKASATNLPALSGTVANATFNVFCFFIDATGTLSTVMGIAGSTLSGVQFPQFQEGKACMGFVVINPTGTGNFVGGTTNLDDATVVPNAVFANTLGAFDPTTTN